MYNIYMQAYIYIHTYIYRIYVFCLHLCIYSACEPGVCRG